MRNKHWCYQRRDKRLIILNVSQVSPYGCKIHLRSLFRFHCKIEVVQPCSTSRALETQWKPLDNPQIFWADDQLWKARFLPRNQHRSVCSKHQEPTMSGQRWVEMSKRSDIFHQKRLNKSNELPCGSCLFELILPWNESSIRDESKTEHNLWIHKC